MQTDIIDNTNLIIIENSKMDQAVQFHQKLSKIPNFNLNIRFPLNRTIIINNDTPNETIYSLDIFVNLAVIIPRNYNAQNFEKDYKIITLFLIKSIKLLNIDFSIVNAISYKIYSYTPQNFGNKVTKTLFGEQIFVESLETIKTLQFDSNFNLINSSQPSPPTFSNTAITQPFNVNTNQSFSTSQSFPTSFGSNPFTTSNVLNNQSPFTFNPFNSNNTNSQNTFGVNSNQTTPFGVNATTNTQSTNFGGGIGITTSSNPNFNTSFNQTPFIFKP